MWTFKAKPTCSSDPPNIHHLQAIIPYPTTPYLPPMLPPIILPTTASTGSKAIHVKLRKLQQDGRVGIVLSQLISQYFCNQSSNWGHWQRYAVVFYGRKRCESKCLSPKVEIVFQKQISMMDRPVKKFSSIPQTSKFSKYIVNTPKPAPKKQPSSQPADSLRNTTLSIYRNMEGAEEKGGRVGGVEGSSIRASLKRAQSKKLDRMEVVNRQLTKDTIKKIKKCNTEEGNEWREMSQLKQYINGMARTCNQISNSYSRSKEQPRDTTREENKQFMMNQLSFTEIDEQKIHLQREVLQKFEHLKGSCPKKMSADARSQQLLRSNEEKIFRCLRMIDKLYRCMQEMENLGYVRKSNKYIISYCTSHRLWLSSVFLYESKEKRDSFSLEFKYYVVPAVDTAKLNFSLYVARVACKDMNLIEEDVEGLLDHAEQVFSQKKLMELSKVSQYIENKLLQAKGSKDQNCPLKYSCLRVHTIEQDKINFTADLRRIQQKFGNMKQISKVSRRRYDDLNKTYQRLQTLM